MVRKRKKRQIDKKKLESDLMELEDSLILSVDQINEFVDGWSSGLHNYSFRNMLMANIQRPNSFKLAGYRDWQKRGRQVFKYQKGLAIFAPVMKRVDKDVDDDEKPEYELVNWRIVYVFDVGQTGVPLDVNYGIAGIRIRFLWDDPEKSIGIDYERDKLVSNNGSLHLNEAIGKLPFPVYVEPLASGADAKTDGTAVWLDSGHEEQYLLATLTHEIAHIELGHFKKDLPKIIQEVEAESCSYIVCRYFGIENEASRFYIQHWKGDKETVKGCGERVVAAAERIVKLLDA